MVDVAGMSDMSGGGDAAFANAVVKFTGEKSGYDAMQASVLANSTATLKQVQQSVDAAFAASDAGMSQTVQNLDAVTEQTQRIGEAIKNAIPQKSLWQELKGAIFGAKEEMTGFGHEAKWTSGGVLEHTQQIYSLVRALFGHFIPGMRLAASEVKMIGREFGGSTKSGVDFAVMGGIVAVTAGMLISKLSEMNKEAKESNFAALTRDVAAAEAGMKKAAKAVADFELDIERTRVSSEKYVGFLNASWSAVLVVSAYLWGSVSRAVNDATETQIKVFDAVGRTTAAIKEQTSANDELLGTLKVDEQRAQSAEELADIYAKEAALLKDNARLKAQQVILDGQAALEAARNAVVAQTDQTKVASMLEQLGVTARRVARESSKIVKDESNTAAATEIANAKNVAAINTKKYEDAAKLAEIQGAGAKAAADAAMKSLKISQQAAESDAAFYAQGLTNVSEYYDTIGAMAVKAAAAETALIESTSANQRAALVTTIASLKAGGNEQQAEIRKLEQFDAATANKRAAIGRTLALTLSETEHQRVEAVRKADATISQLEQDLVHHRSEMGQISAKDEIVSLNAVTDNEKLSAQQRMKAQEQVFTQSIVLMQSETKLLQATDQMTERAALDTAGAIVGAYKEGSKKRIAAETEFAGQVKTLWGSLVSNAKSAFETVTKEAKRMWDAVSGAGQTAQQMAADSLAKQGKTSATDKELEEEWGRIVEKNKESLAAIKAGGSATAEERAQIVQVAAVYKTMNKENVTGAQAMRQHVDEVSSAMRGETASASEMSQTLAGANQTFGQMVEKAKATAAAIAAGVPVLEKDRVEMESVAETFAKMTKDGVQGTQAMSAYGTDMVNKLSGVLTPLSSIRASVDGVTTGMSAVALEATNANIEFIRASAVAKAWGDSVARSADVAAPLEKTNAAAAAVDATFEKTGAAAEGVKNAVAALDASAKTMGPVFQQSGRIASESMHQIVSAASQVKTVYESAASCIPTAFKNAYSGALAATDTFIAELNAKVTAGMSELADSIYNGLISRITQTLDSDALRST